MPGTCFVVMGFGEKTDFPTGRVLNLDKTYKNIIKPAVTAAGLECIRADEIVHTGVIDVPMYKNLLDADVVIADLSTANANAFYELGVRHALRPYTTIAIAESKLKYPFDVNHTVIRTYEHLGSGIDFDEVERFRAEITAAINQVLDKKQSDSPVYVYLHDLQPPRYSATANAVAGPLAIPSANEPSVRSLLDDAEVAMAASDFAKAKALLIAARTLRPQETFIVQRLALATYKSGQPSKAAALEEGRVVLRELKPEASNDPETLGLWGAVHKGLWTELKDRSALDTSIVAYEKGFYLRNDYYNGINLAFLFNVRASISPPAEAIADFVQAERVRRHVLRLVDARLEDDKLSAAEKYWVLATGAEAAFGIGDKPGYEEWMRRALDIKPHPWMIQTTSDQIAKLTALLHESPMRFLNDR